MFALTMLSLHRESSLHAVACLMVSCRHVQAQGKHCMLTCLWRPAGMCKYEIHEDDLQFDPLKEEYDALPQKEKDRCGSRYHDTEDHACMPMGGWS